MAIIMVVLTGVLIIWATKVLLERTGILPKYDSSENKLLTDWLSLKKQAQTISKAQAAEGIAEVSVAPPPALSPDHPQRQKVKRTAKKKKVAPKKKAPRKSE